MYLVGELFAQKRLEPVLSVFVGLQVQVQADDRKGARLEVGETVEPRGKLFKAVACGEPAQAACLRSYFFLS